MSKFRPRIIINDPEKNVPSNIIEQFFLTIKSGDLDKIRDFAIQYKNKYNLIEKSTKGKGTESEKTPFHVVLELDDKIADNKNKLRIMKYLDIMGAPMDLPDSSDVWPIHLAAALQSPEILDFMIKKKVLLNRKDSSNNTPLHYAINGKEIDCPKSLSIKALTPPQNIDKLPMNETLGKTNQEIVKYLNSEPTIKNNLIHIINTIMNIPKMYENDKFAIELQSDAVKIFSDIATSETFPSNEKDERYINNLNEQQNKLEQVIEKAYSKINDDLLKGVTNKLTIEPNRKGWGPTIPTDTGPRQPTEIEKIMEEDSTSIKKEMENNFLTIKNQILAINTAQLDDSALKSINYVQKLANDNILKLIFCTGCESLDNGEEVGLTKMLFLLTINNYVREYPTTFANKVMDTFLLMDQGIFGQIRDGNRNNPRYGANIQRVLFNRLLDSVITDISFPAANNYDNSIRQFALDFISLKEEMRQKLKELFSNSNNKDVTPIDLYQSELKILSLEEFVKKELEHFSALLMTLNKKQREMSWFKLLRELISTIEPQAKSVSTT